MTKWYPAPKRVLNPELWPIRSDSVWLYRYFDINHRLLYIGIAVDPLHRYIEHAHDCYIHLVAFIEMTEYPNRAAALSAESAAIVTECPPHNSRVSGGGGVWIDRLAFTGTRPRITLSIP
jgi:hypothetical protein